MRLATLIVLPLLVAAVVAQPCPMKRVETGWLCEQEKRILTRHEIVKVGGAYVCRSCARAPLTIDVCIVTTWRCGCGLESKIPGPCPRCGHVRDARVWRAQVKYHCRDCRGEVGFPGFCAQPGCPSYGRPLAAVCSRSGTFPHGGRRRVICCAQPRRRFWH